MLLKSYLLSVLQVESTSARFLVNGWLIPDDAERNSAKRFLALDIDRSKKGVSCDLDQVPEVFDQFLDLGLKYLTGKRYDLTIEVFLPLDYLHEAVDKWEILDLGKKVSIGTRHRVLVRTSDRLKPKYLRQRH